MGREIVRLLAADGDVGEIRALVRRETPAVPSKVRILKADFERLDEHPDWFRADAVFCALGTTLRQAGSQEAFRRVDYSYPLAIAKLAREVGTRHFLLVSALGADLHSRAFYNRVKGEVEEAVLSLGYPSLTIARPSLLLGERGEPRPMEDLAKKLGWLVPPRWRPVHAAQVAAALVQAARRGAPGVHILENRALRATS